MNEEVMKEILKAAKEEFLTLGYTEASMRNIAKKANLTTGSLYYRFLDKAEMLDAVVGNEAEELLTMFNRIQNDFAKKEIENQKAKLQAEVKEEVGSLAIDIASKVLEREVSAADNKKVIDECLKGWDNN